MEIFLLIILIILVLIFQSGIANRMEKIEKLIKRMEDQPKQRTSSTEEKATNTSSPKTQVYTPTPSATPPIRKAPVVEEKKIEPETPVVPPVEELTIKETLPSYVVEERIEEAEKVEPEKISPEEERKALDEHIEKAALSSTDPEALENKKYFEPKQTPLPKQKEQATQRVQPKPSAAATQDWYERFRAKNPDLEKFIGENILSKIAITILVLGIGFFVKYAIDKEWINEIARVGIGMLAGGIVLGFAHRLRKQFSAFSSVLVGGGIAIFYFTIGIGFHQYHIFGQTTAFVIMFLITAFAVFISIAYNRIELAILSLLGGFATPFMVSTGQGNYQVLFTYIIVLDLGMLVLSYFKRWNLIKIISYVLTLLLYIGWLESKVMGIPGAPYAGAFFFGTCFYILFFAMNMINNLREKRPFDQYEISILLSNTFIYYGLGMQILDNFHPELQGLFSISMAIFNMACAWFLYKRLNTDRKFIYTMIGLTLTFVSISGPVQLEGNYITLFWALEALLLMWLAQRSGIHLYRFTSVLILILMVISLAMDWAQNYASHYGVVAHAIILNKGFLTGLFSSATVLLTLYLLKREIAAQGGQDIRIIYNGLSFSARNYKRALRALLIVLLYVGGLIELVYQFNQRTYLDSGLTIIVLCYHMLALSLVNFKYGSTNHDYSKKVLLFINLLTCVVFVVFGIVLALNDFTENLVSMHRNFTGFIFHYVNIVLALFIASKTWQQLKTSDSITGQVSFALPALIMACVVYLLSVELILHVSLIRLQPISSIDAGAAVDKHIEYRNLLRHVVKIGFPILWGLISFAFLSVGLKRKIRHLRIGALVLIAIILVKLFTYDISNASEAGKIIAFIILGVVLLVISFLYQKIKALVVDDTKGQTETSNLENENPN